MESYYAIFPTMVYEGHYDTPKTIREAVEKNIFDHLDRDGFGGEKTGNVKLHLDPFLDELFVYATKSAKQFIKGYKMDPEIFDYNIVKTWVNVLHNTSTPYHHHRDAHISFVYYLNVPKEQSMAIKFYDTEYKHEPFNSMLRCNPVSEYNNFNSTSWFFNVTEGQIMVFPSSLPHSVDCENNSSVHSDTAIKTVDDLRTYRVSIAGDIILTHKETTTNPTGLQPMSQWRKFK